MIFFRVSENINIKTTDGTIVNYFKYKQDNTLVQEWAYITTYDDYNELKEVFKRVDEKKYSALLLLEDKIRKIENFPIELGIANQNEILKHKRINSKNYINRVNKGNYVEEFLIGDNKVNLYEQLENIKKDEIKVAVIGSLGRSISEIFSSCAALRIFYDKLSQMYKNVQIDLFINASNNSYYSRDKSIYETQKYINKIAPLSINVKTLISYDCFIDNSSYGNSIYFKELNLVDAWLYKFGIDYKSIPDNKKYNTLDISEIKIKDTLKSKLEEIKPKGKMILYHPYSANAKKSIPQVFAVELLKKLILENEDCYIVSALSIDPKIKDDRFIDLSKESKFLNDFIYIISKMDAIITVDTSTYHISEALMIPTIVLFAQNEYEKKIKYYNFIKPLKIEDKSKNLSKFIFENDDLTFYKFDSWKELDSKKIIKLLESF